MLPLLARGSPELLLSTLGLTRWIKKTMNTYTGLIGELSAASCLSY